MIQFLFQPASGRAARRHFADTVETPVSQRRLARFLPIEERRTLSRIYGGRSAPTWGLVPGKNDANVPTWRHLTVGDVVLFAGNKMIYASALVTHKTVNMRLARDLWGRDPRGQTWELVYFLDDLRPQSIPYSDFKTAAAYQPNFTLRRAMIANKSKTTGIVQAFPELTIGIDEPVNAREYLTGLVGSTILTVSGKPNRIIAIQDDDVIVGTDQSPEGRPVSIELVQSALDKLFTDGEVDISVDSVGYRSAFVGAVLASLPNAQPQKGPARVSTRAVTTRGWREPPEIADAADLVGELTDGQRAPGRRQSAAERQAIEKRALAVAIAHYKDLGWTVRDVGPKASYDLQCTKDGKKLHVEVKGTTSLGSKVLLTRNEVNHARGTDAQLALFVVADINLHKKGGKPRASGGRSIIVDPWDIETGTLEALA